MNSRNRQSQQRRALATNLFGLCVATVLLVTAPSSASADPITYNFSPVVLAGGDTISGTFTFDPTGSPFGATLNSVDLVVTGPTHPGTYTSPEGGAGAIEPANEIDLLSASAGFSIFFANPLGNAPDNVTAVDFFSPSILDLTPSQGTAVPAAAAVPEPSSLILLGSSLAGLGLFGLRRRKS